MNNKFIHFRSFLFVLCIASFVGCVKDQRVQSNLIPLDKNWMFHQVGKEEWLPAQVPGCVHTDLLANKKIEDPFLGMNEKKVQWIENESWEYRNEFEIDSKVLNHESVEMIFEGLDTYSDVMLNGEKLLSSDNMFVCYTADCKKLLKAGKNELKIYFRSPVKQGLKKLKKLDYTLQAANEQAPDSLRTNVYTRKAPFHFGWDWGPRLVTSGIWRPVYIRFWDKSRIENIQLVQKDFSKEKVVYKAVVSVKSSKEFSAGLKLLIDGFPHQEKMNQKLVVGENKLELEFAIDQPKLWWTNGLGKQPLYDIKIQLMDGLTQLDSKITRLGVRKLEVITDKDSIGNSFMVRLNDVPVFMKGSNYIPNDIFVTRQTTEIYKRLMKDAVDANMNMLRVWGGAIYENDEFYDLCDENGILVWHDFMHACSMMPGDAEHLENIKRESEENVVRLRNHPCMALWCGNNENWIAWHYWGWGKSHNKEDSTQLWNTYKKIFYNILPEAVAKNDSGRFYWASSPQSSQDKAPNTKSGDQHDWSVYFGMVDFESYELSCGRFVSEYGMQSYPEMKTLESFAKPEDMQYNSKLMDFRQRSNVSFIKPGWNGNDVIYNYMERYFKIPAKFENFVYVSQCMQAENFRNALEIHRRAMPFCMGSLYWQINDCWPTISWASIDYFGHWKASHYFVKRANAPLLVSPKLNKNEVEIFVVSDKLETTAAKLKINAFHLDGRKIFTLEENIMIQPNTSKIYKKIDKAKILGSFKAQEVVVEVILLNSKNEKISENILTFDRMKNLLLQKPKIDMKVKKVNHESTITISTDKPAFYVSLQSDVADGKFEENFFHIFPGENKTIKYQAPCRKNSTNFSTKSLYDAN